MEYEVCRKSRFAKKSLGLLYEVFSEIILTEKNVINDGFSD